MSSVKVFDDGLHNDDVLRTSIIEVSSVTILAIKKCTSFCQRLQLGYVNNDCSANQLLFISPVVHFAKYQKFFTTAHCRKIKDIINELKKSPYV